MFVSDTVTGNIMVQFLFMYLMKHLFAGFLLFCFVDNQTICIMYLNVLSFLLKTQLSIVVHAMLVLMCDAM